MPKRKIKSVAKPRKKIIRKKKTETAAVSRKVKRDEGMHRTKIRVIGIGGGGSTIAAEIAPVVNRVDFWAANTDLQALGKIGKKCRHFLFGHKITDGLGCGSDPRLGQLAAKQATDKISSLFQGIDLCILVSCLGGGTGSGSISEFAQRAKEAGCITLGVFTLPFRFEGEKKMQAARQALARAIPFLSASVIFPNEKIFHVLDMKTGFQAALSAVNDILANDLKNLMETVYLPGLINIDFADLRAILEGEGKFAYLASATFEGDNRAENACKALLAHPLNEYDPRGADRILFNITSEKNISIAEVEHISKTISALNPRAKIIFGISQRTSPSKGLTITLLATGFAPKINSKEVRTKKKVNRKSKVLESGTLPQSHKKEDSETEKIAEKKEEKTKIPKIIKKLSAANKKKRVKIGAKMAERKKRNENTGKGGRIFKAKQGDLTKAATTGDENIKQRNLFSKSRKNALDLKKEAELAEQEQLADERKWDIPAFLRRRVE